MYVLQGKELFYDLHYFSFLVGAFVENADYNRGFLKDQQIDQLTNFYKFYNL